MSTQVTPTIIFLDIDGVLNSFGWKMARHYYQDDKVNILPSSFKGRQEKRQAHPEKLGSEATASIISSSAKSGQAPFHHLLEELDLTAIAIFESLLIDTDAKVVISSDWRLLNPGIDWLKALLFNRGAKILPDVIVGKTPVVANNRGLSQRGDEVEAFLADKPELRFNFICVDDCSFQYHPYQRVVETNPAIGFSILDYQKALGYLIPPAKTG